MTCDMCHKLPAADDQNLCKPCEYTLALLALSIPMTEQERDERAQARLTAIITHAVTGLAVDDLAERIQWCRQHNVHGAVAHFDNDDDTIRLEFGGRPLAVIDRAVLLEDDPTFAPVYVPDLEHVPDEWSDEWTDDSTDEWSDDE